MVVTGRLSIRDEKEPQIVINRARPISDFADGTAKPEPEPPAKQVRNGTLYLKLPGEAGVIDRKVRAILNMFPGDCSVVLYYADTGVRRGTRCQFMDPMIQELKKVLGEGNVVLK